MRTHEIDIGDYESVFCNNFIEGKPVLTLAEAEEIVGRKLSLYGEYDEIYNMGGTISKDELHDIGMAIRVTKRGVMDEYGEAILTKDAVKAMIDLLQKYYERYDEIYDKYLENYRNRVIEFVKSRFAKDEQKQGQASV